MLATAGDDSRGRIIDARTGEHVQTLRGHSDAILALSFYPVRGMSPFPSRGRQSALGLLHLGPLSAWGSERS